MDRNSPGTGETHSPTQGPAHVCVAGVLALEFILLPSRTRQWSRPGTRSAHTRRLTAGVRRCYPHVSEVNDKKRKEALQAACACAAMAAIVRTSRFIPYQRSVVGHQHDNNSH